MKTDVAKMVLFSVTNGFTLAVVGSDGSWRWYCDRTNHPVAIDTMLRFLSGDYGIPIELR